MIRHGTRAAPSRLSFRRLEQILIAFLSSIALSTIWMATVLEVPTTPMKLPASPSKSTTISTTTTTTKATTILVNPHEIKAVTPNDNTDTQSQEKLPNSISTNITTTTTKQYLWTNNPRIPEWIQTYMDWHTSVRQSLNESNWNQYKYLVLRCFRNDINCGGVSDRLKPVPLVLLAAQRSNRLLFIHWTKPCALENFLIPPPNGGLDWTVPSFLLPMIYSPDDMTLVARASYLIEKAEKTDYRSIHTHIHDFQGGSTQYNEVVGPDAFAMIYHDLFRIMFQPTLPIQQLLDQKLVPTTTTTTTTISSSKTTKQSHHLPTNTTTSTSSFRLIPGDYSVAHYRAEYGKEVRRHPYLTEPSFLKRVTLNAIRCASEMQPGLSKPIYFASDNALALETARELAQLHNYPIITFDRTEGTPLVLDQYLNITNITVTTTNITNNHNTSTTSTIVQTIQEDYPPSAYYSTFVDLLLAGSGKCVAHGRGGFGRYASLLSYNVSCAMSHVKNFQPVICKGLPPFVLEDE